MGVTAEWVLGLARERIPEADDNDHTRMGVIRSRYASFLPTWLSALELSGVALAPELAAELATCRRRVARFREIVGDLRAAFPEARAVKGIEVVDLYPPGLLRQMNDIDVVAPDDRTANAIVAFLADRHGMRIPKSTVTFEADGGQGFIVSIEAPPGHPLAQRLNAEVTNVAWVGNGAAVPARARLPLEGFGHAGHFVMIVAEGLEGPYSPKDLVDAAVLLRQLTPGDARGAAETVARLRVQPEAAELIGALREAGVAVPQPLVDVTARPLPARLSRTGKALGAALREPRIAAMRYLQRAEVFDCAFQPLRRQAWRAVDRALPVSSPARRRLWRFGVPATVAAEREDLAIRTPVGDFLAVNSGAVGARWQALEGVTIGG